MSSGFFGVHLGMSFFGISVRTPSCQICNLASANISI